MILRSSIKLARRCKKVKISLSTVSFLSSLGVRGVERKEDAYKQEIEEKIHKTANRINDKRKMRRVVGNKRVRGEDI